MKSSLSYRDRKRRRRQIKDMVAIQKLVKQLDLDEASYRYCAQMDWPPSPLFTEFPFDIERRSD